MQYRFLGRSGLQVSALSFGAWVTFGDQIEEDVAFDCMKAAVDAGVNFFDNAEAYADGRAETIMGNVIRRAGWKRSDFVLSTKIFWGGAGSNDCGLSRKHIFEGTNAALRRLQTEYVDLIFCHRPDRHTPIEETLWAMNLLIHQGKALYWGTSEWTAEQIRCAYEMARREHLIPPTMEQPQYNLFVRERVEKEYAPLYDAIGLGTTTWSPLASGLLTGKYLDGIPEGSRLSLSSYKWLRDRLEQEGWEERMEKVRRLASLSAELGTSLAQMSIAWCLKHPHVSTVITGASRPSQVVENMKALAVADKLTPEVMERMEQIVDNKPQPDMDWRGLLSDRD